MVVLGIRVVMAEETIGGVGSVNAVVTAEEELVDKGSTVTVELAVAFAVYWSMVRGVSESNRRDVTEAVE